MSLTRLLCRTAPMAIFAIVIGACASSSLPMVTPLTGPTTPEGLFEAWNGKATGFFQQVREPDDGFEGIYVVLLAPEAAQCDQLSDLEAVTNRGALRVDILAPSWQGMSWGAGALAQQANVTMSGPGYEDAVLLTPVGGDFSEIRGDLVRGDMKASLPPDPVNQYICGATGRVGDPASLVDCTCSHHSGATTTCSLDSMGGPPPNCCLGEQDGNKRIDVAFEARPCPALCEGLKRIGYECLD